MKRINLHQYSELKEIVQSLHQNFDILGNSDDFNILNDIWFFAVTMNKRQNEAIKDYKNGDDRLYFQPVHTINLYDEKEGKLMDMHIKPYKYQFTRKEWFIIIYCERMITKSIQEVKRCIDFYRENKKQFTGLK